MNNGSETTTLWLNGAAPVQDFNNLKKEWAPTTFDVNQRVVVSDLLDLPFGRGRRFLSSVNRPVNAIISGWGVDTILTYQGGFPLYITDAVDTSGSYGGNQRPNYAPCTGGIKIAGSAESRLGKWFNTSCFAQPASYTFGNVSRTSI